MKSKLAALALLALALALTGCPSIATEYVDADKATYEAVGAEYRQYVTDDSKLSAAQKDLRFATLDSWKLRIEAARKDAE